jgi:hypothetical protein
MGHVLFKWDIIIGWGYFKNIFSRTTGPILTRLGTSHLWEGGKYSLFFFKERECPSPRGRNSRVKIQ